MLDRSPAILFIVAKKHKRTGVVHHYAITQPRHRLAEPWTKTELLDACEALVASSDELIATGAGFTWLNAADADDAWREHDRRQRRLTPANGL